MFNNLYAMDKILINLQCRKSKTSERLKHTIFIGIGGVYLAYVFALSICKTISWVFRLGWNNEYILLGSTALFFWPVIFYLKMTWDKSYWRPCNESYRFECQYCKKGLFTKTGQEDNIKCDKCETLHVINWSYKVPPPSPPRNW